MSYKLERAFNHDIHFCLLWTSIRASELSIFSFGIPGPLELQISRRFAVLIREHCGRWPHMHARIRIKGHNVEIYKPELLWALNVEKWGWSFWHKRLTIETEQNNKTSNAARTTKNQAILQEAPVDMSRNQYQ